MQLLLLGKFQLLVLVTICFQILLSVCASSKLLVLCDLRSLQSVTEL